MSKFEFQNTERRFEVALDRMRAMIEDFSAYQDTLQQQEKFFGRREKRLSTLKTSLCKMQGSLEEMQQALDKELQKTKRSEEIDRKLARRNWEEYMQHGRWF